MDFNDVVEKLEKVGGAPFGDSRRHSSAIRRNSSARRRHSPAILPPFFRTSLTRVPHPPPEQAGGNARVRNKLNFIRNVQQGLCGIEDIDDYELAERGDGAAAADGDDPFAGDDGGGLTAANLERHEASAAAAAAAGGGGATTLTAEQRERADRTGAKP